MTGAGVIKETKWTKGTATGDALREWIKSVEATSDPVVEEGVS